MENDNKTHPSCALLNGKRASMDYCRTFTMFRDKNLAGCVASKCPSLGRKCYLCLRDGIRPPATLVDGVCRFHGAVGALEPKEIVKVQAVALRQIFDPEVKLRQSKSAREKRIQQHGTQLSEEDCELRRREEAPRPKALAEAGTAVAGKPKATLVFFSPVPPPADLPQLTGQAGERDGTCVKQSKKSGRKIETYDSPEDLEARAERGRRALEMSDEIEEAAKAGPGSIASKARTWKITSSEASELRRLQKLSSSVKEKVAKGQLTPSAAATVAFYPRELQSVLFEALKNGTVTVGSLTHGLVRVALRQDRLREELETLGIELPEEEK